MQVCDIEFIITDTDTEALNLESNLIKSKQSKAKQRKAKQSL